MYTLLGVPDTPSIVLVKKFTYRDAAEEWSNKYHFSGTVPANYADWVTLASALGAQEKTCYTGKNTIVRAYGYEAGVDHAVAVMDYTVAPLSPIFGTLSETSNHEVPGDVAATVRWWTGQFNSRGKRIYCRKYFHGVLASDSDTDELDVANKTPMTTFAAKVIDGTLPGSFKYCGPQGAVLSLPVVDKYLTTRTLKRRGKRPPTT